jgi:hypothetical protein
MSNAKPIDYALVNGSGQKESLANIQSTIQIHPGEILPDWVHDDEIKALLDRGLIAPRELFGVLTKVGRKGSGQL